MGFSPAGLTQEQLETLKNILSSKLESLTSEVKEFEATLTKEDNDDKDSPDEVDRSSFEEEMQRTQLVLDGKKHILFEVREALRRMDDNTYGVCEESEEPIGYKRLLATPWTRLSVEAQTELEQRRRNRPRLATGGYPSAYDPGDSDEE